ncbi:MAG: hypothetical protein JSV69_05205, partial [Chloroflexota bacterium]
YVRGEEVKWAGFYKGQRRQKLVLPTYPFVRERYWLTPVKTGTPAAPVLSSEAHPQLGHRLRSPHQVYETTLDFIGLSDQEEMLRKMVAAAADELYGKGVHQINEFEVEPLSNLMGRSIVQTIITPSNSRSAQVEIYVLGADQAGWELLTRAQVSPGKIFQPEDLSAEDDPNQQELDSPSNRKVSQEIDTENGQPVVENRLRAESARILGLEPDRLPIDQPLDQLGLDSLMAMELKNRIENAFGAVIPIVNLLQGPSISQLSDQVIEQLAEPSLDHGIKLAAVSENGKDQPLAYNQQSLWFLRQLIPEDVSFNVSGAVRIRGNVNISHLRNGLEKIMARHASLRTTFSVVEGKPVQRIHESFPVPLEIVDGKNWTESDLQEYIIGRAHQPFDLENNPAFRVVLIHNQSEVQSDSAGELTAGETVLLLAMDHIISDFWSVGILVREMMGYYQAVSSDLPLNMEPLKYQYTDYAHWQREMLA